MREVGVHLHDVAGAAGEGVVEAGDVRGAEALLARAVEHLDVGGMRGGQPVRDGARAVRRRVVDHQDAEALGRAPASTERTAATTGSRLAASS